MADLYPRFHVIKIELERTVNSRYDKLTKFRSSLFRALLDRSPSLSVSIYLFARNTVTVLTRLACGVSPFSPSCSLSLYLYDEITRPGETPRRE